MELDRTIHEPVRLRIMAMLGGVDTVDFNFLVSTLGLSKGNLSSHIEKLEAAGYVQVTKGFNGKITHTQLCPDHQGAKGTGKALENARCLAHREQAKITGKYCPYAFSDLRHAQKYIAEIHGGREVSLIGTADYDILERLACSRRSGPDSNSRPRRSSAERRCTQMDGCAVQRAVGVDIRS